MRTISSGNFLLTAFEPGPVTPLQLASHFVIFACVSGYGRLPNSFTRPSVKLMRTSKITFVPSKATLDIVILAVASIALAGCGIGSQAGRTSAAAETTQAVAFGGILHGGPNPVIGSTVKLYATGTTYGAGTFLAEAMNQSTGGATAGYDTDSSGHFAFNSTYNCPAKQFAYIVASGGNPGAGTNTDAVLVAAIGRCEDLTTSTVIYMNELSTIAAAYALGHFSTVSCGTVGTACTSANQSGTSLLVGMGAPLTANSQTFTDASGHSAGCVANSFYQAAGTCATTATATLYHAFLNAANLMPVLYYQPSAVSTIPNPGTTVSPPIVNNRMLNSLGNMLVACMNSLGGTAGDGSVCGNLFNGAVYNGNTPTNTFQAMINIASNPTLAGNPGGYTPTTLLNLASGYTSSYSPTLVTTASSPVDLALTIFYPGASTQTSGIGLGMNTTTPFQGIVDAFQGGTDINDTIYVGNQTATGTSSTKGNLVSFSSNGTLLSSSPDSTTYVQLTTPTPGRHRPRVHRKLFQHVVGCSMGKRDQRCGHVDGPCCDHRPGRIE